MAVGSLVTLPVFQNGIRAQPLTWNSGARVPYIDAYFHLALAGGLANRGPTRFPWVESEPLGYHWFSHAWVAQVSNVSGAGLDEVLFVFLPLFIPLMAVILVATAAVRLSGRVWTGPVAAILMMAGGDLNVFGKLSPGYPISVLSPSLTFGAPLLIATVIVLALRWRRELLRGGVVLLPLVCIGAAGAKGSTVPLVIAGLGLGCSCNGDRRPTTRAASPHRPHRRRGMLPARNRGRPAGRGREPADRPIRGGGTDGVSRVCWEG